MLVWLGRQTEQSIGIVSPTAEFYPRLDNWTAVFNFVLGNQTTVVNFVLGNHPIELYIGLGSLNTGLNFWLCNHSTVFN